MSSQPGAIVVGGSINGLNAVRALASYGMPVAVVVTSPGEIAHYSRWVTEHHELFDFFNRTDSLLDLLEHHARRWDGWAVLPTGDEALAVLSRNRERLERRYRILTPPWEVARNLLHKDSTYEAANKLGIDIPHVYGEATPEVASVVSFPVVVKPVESRPFVSRFGVKLFVARDRTELLRHIQELRAAGLRAQILDLVPGPDSLFYNYTVYIDRAGQPIAELPMRKLRKSPPFFGVVRVAEITKVPQLREPTLNLLRHIEWRGMASAEYKLDPRDGRYRLMEINGRCFLIHALARRAGVNYPLLAWREAVLGEKVSASPNGWDGVWIHLLDDIYYGVFYRGVEQLSLREYLAPYRRPKCYAVWSASDPKPFLMQCYLNLRKAATAAVSARDRAIFRSRVQGMPVDPRKPV